MTKQNAVSLIPEQSAFSLVELLVVMAIFVLLAAIAIPAFNATGDAGRMTKAGGDLSGVLEKARTYAMANNTYVWVGLLPDSSEQATWVGVVASRNGQAPPVPAADLEPMGPVRRLDRVNLGIADAASHARPTGQQITANSSAIMAFSIFSNGKKRDFDKYVVQFNPRGEARIRTANPDPVIEVGLVPFSGSTHNFAAIQVGGLTGGVQVYRP